MIYKKLQNFIRVIRRKPDSFSIFFTDRYPAERKKIIEKAVKGANEDQRKQAKEYREMIPRVG